MTHSQSRRLGRTNLHLGKCQVNLSRMLRQVPCPTGKNHIPNHIRSQSVKGVGERHLVARGSNEITRPGHPTAETLFRDVRLQRSQCDIDYLPRR